MVGNPWKTWLSVRLEAAIYDLGHLHVGASPFDAEVIASRMLRDAYPDGGRIQAEHPCRPGDRLPLVRKDRERREGGE